MAVYTCSEMIAGCLDGQDAAWRHFVIHYLPLAAALLDRHLPGLAPRREELLREVVVRAREDDARFLRDYRGQSEREFLLHLRDHVLRIALREAPGTDPEISLDGDAFDQALAGLTALERQVVWMHLLGPAAGLDKILRLDSNTIQATMEKAHESLRRNCDRWSRDMLVGSRQTLIKEARSRVTPDCPPAKTFLRLLDGQLTWRDRTDLENHLTKCWPCIDVLCRLRETVFLAHGLKPLPAPEADRCCQAIGIQPERPSRWRRLLPGAQRR